MFLDSSHYTVYLGIVKRARKAPEHVPRAERTEIWML